MKSRIIIILTLVALMAVPLNSAARGGKGNRSAGNSSTVTSEESETTHGSGGNSNPGDLKGDLYGDLFVILRDDAGEPILSEDGFVQPIDADGNLIPINDEGEIAFEADAELVQEIEFGRLNIGRAPDTVLAAGYEEAISAINASSDFSLDAAGRLVLLVGGEPKTIDSARENLALYYQLLSDGYLKDITVDMGDYLNQLKTPGELTQAKLDMAASFLAGAADKGSTFDIDELMYFNSILGLNSGDSYVDFGSYAYDRVTTFSGVTAYVLVSADITIEDPTGIMKVYYEDEVDILSFAFDNLPFTSPLTGARAFADSVNDAILVITYVHEFTVPEEVDVEIRVNGVE